MRFGCIDCKNSGKEERRHGSPNGPSMTRGTSHTAERICQSAGNRKNHDDLKEICERSGILVRVCAVGVKKAASVRAELFNGFLRSYGALRNNLGRGRCCVEWLHLLIRMKILDGSLRHQDKREDETRRK